MAPASLGRLVVQSLRRNARALGLAAAGIVLGVAMLTFFLAFAGGARQVLLGEVFPVDRLEFEPARAGLLARPTVIDDGLAARIAARPEVSGAWPKMRLAFPARGQGGREILGRDFRFDLSGFVDGVAPAFVADEFGGADGFRDAGGDSSPRVCAGDADCAEDEYCVSDRRACARPVPVLVSRHLVEIYNGSVAPAHGWPRIRDWMASRFRGLTFTVELGRSYVGGDAARGTPVRLRFRVLGVSDKAMRLGITVPLEQVRRWNREYAGEEAARRYSSLVVRVRSKSDVTPLVAWARSLGLAQADSEAERVGLFVTLGTWLLGLIGVLVVAVAALGVAHTFLMAVAERRREIGVLRAVGATRGDVRALVLGEAAAVGLVAGAAGVALALVAALVCDRVASRLLPDFPFKPETFFSFTWQLGAGAVVFAVVCAVLGALVPAQRAARMDPADALS